MDQLLSFFETMPDEYRAIFPLLVLAFCWLFEFLSPLKNLVYPKIKHDAVNLLLFATNAIVLALVVVILGGTMIWSTETEFGLLYHLGLPVWLHLLVSLMILDFVGQYAMHYLLHHVKWMWRLHMVHHSDVHVDATTGTRHHAFDLLSRELAIVATVVLVGIPIVYYVLYRMIMVFFTYSIHANFKIPKALDRLLCWVFVTPDMHKFHHHREAPWTDSNYGGLLSIWDRMFGTFVYADTDDIQYGLDVLDDERELEVKYLYLLPFDSSIPTNGRPGLFQRYSD